MAAVSDCFLLTFRGIARFNDLAWTSLTCRTEGVLDRIERVSRFTEIRIRAILAVPEGTDMALAEHLLHKAERGCLITNSLNSTIVLETEVRAEEAAPLTAL